MFLHYDTVQFKPVVSNFSKQVQNLQPHPIQVTGSMLKETSIMFLVSEF